MSGVMRKMLIGIIIAAGVIAAAVLLRHSRPATGSSATDTGSDSSSASRSGELSPPKSVEPSNGDSELPPLIRTTDPFPLPEVLIDPEVIIDKGTRLLTVLSDGEPVKHYRIALGRMPVGHKEREGDNRTPEGSYYVCTKNEASKYHRSLGLSYPNEEDADTALAGGLINRRDHKSITSAIRRMAQPPWNTRLGGEIMIHGGGSGRGDWTEGCVALDDQDAEELFTALPMGATVTIRP